MNRKTISMAALALGAGAVLALAAPLSASAHVTASATSTAAGSYTVVTFSVGHGCEGSPTTVVTIDIPEGILSVTPTVNPNWTISKVSVPLEPAAGEQTERPGQVVYTAIEPLAADQRDTFSLSLKLPEGEAGEVVEFPVTQDCVEGQNLWIGEDVPSITLTAAVEGDELGHDAAAEGEHNDDAMTVTSVTSTDDVLARVLGIGGLVVGTVGIVLAVTARRTKGA